jgi:putative transposase
MSLPRALRWRRGSRKLTEQKARRIEEGHLLADHVHMLISIPPKHSVSQVIGCIKGKSTIHIARTFLGKQRTFTGQHFWARGYFVSTVGRDEETVRKHIRHQEEEDKRIETFAQIRGLSGDVDVHRREQRSPRAGRGSG